MHVVFHYMLEHVHVFVLFSVQEMKATKNKIKCSMLNQSDTNATGKNSNKQITTKVHVHCIKQYYNCDTVEPVLKDHPIGHTYMVSQDRWSLVIGSIACNVHVLVD